MRDSVFQAYVLPEHYFLQIDAEAQGEGLWGGRGCSLSSLRPELRNPYSAARAGGALHPLQRRLLSALSPPLPADLESPTGVLVVEVVEAKRVPRMDLLSRSSPFVE